MTNWAELDVEEAGPYFKHKEPGSWKIRIMTDPVEGYQWWVDTEVDGETKSLPHRVRTLEEVPSEIQFHEEDDKRHQRFWAFVIYNHEHDRFQVYTPTQQSIVKKIVEFATMADDLGPLFSFPIKLIRKGTGMGTKYSLTNLPAVELDVDDSIVEMINLDALFESDGDPFAGMASQMETVSS